MKRTIPRPRRPSPSPWRSPPGASAAEPAKLPDRCACPTRLDRHHGDQRASLGLLLKALGYEQKVETLAVPITFESLEDRPDRRLPRQLDAGAEPFVEPLLRARCDLIRSQPRAVQFTLAVPNYVAEAGVEDFDDLAAARRQVRQARSTASIPARPPTRTSRR